MITGALLRQAADMIWEKGAFELKPHLLKGHEKNPNEPLSPYFFNLRDENNPKPGPLKREDFHIIAWCMWNVIMRELLDFQVIAPIPRAGEPIVAAMAAMDKFFDFRVIPLNKIETKEGRRIVPKKGFEYRSGEVILLIDDLITKAETKLEAIKSLESVGCIVRDLVVLIDRQQGGKEQLEQAGYRVHCAFTAKELFGYYLVNGRLSLLQYNECMDYLNHF